MLLPLMLLWLAIGAAVGYFVSKVVNLRGDDPLGGIAVAAVGAGVLGVACNLFTGYGLTGWNIWSCALAAAGGAVAVAIWHVVRAFFVSHDRGTVRRSY
jgi:uncharacterized membrane protein YeaQ/YmgE (transglycosylase-associated protein family)